MPALLVARNGEEAGLLSERTRGLYKDCVGLPLWPDALTVFEAAEVAVIQPAELVTNADHFVLAQSVINAATKWWEILYPGVEEPHIDGLGVSEIFRYEIEQGLSKLLFDALQVRRAISQGGPDRIIFAENLDSDFRNPGQRLCNLSSLLPFLGSFPLVDLLPQDSACSVERLEYRSVATKPDLLANVEGWLARFATVLFERDFARFERWFSARQQGWSLQAGAVVFAMNGRCFSGLIDRLGPSVPVAFLPARLQGGQQAGVREYLWDPANHDVAPLAGKFFTVDDLDYAPAMVSLSRQVQAQLPLLRAHYRALRQMALDARPAAFFLTHAGSFNCVSAWAFAKAGTRVILHYDGIGHPTKDVLSVAKSFMWLQSPFEKWVVSRHAEEALGPHSSSPAKLKVTGFMERSYARPSRRGTSLALRTLRAFFGFSRQDRIVLYALSFGSPNGMRLISEETIFEVFAGARSACEVLTQLPRVAVMIKLHPGSRHFLPIFRKILPDRPKLRFVCDVPIRHLVDISNVSVLYHSDAGFDTLFRGKHLVIYNHTQRPSYLTEFAPNLNQDPRKGPAVRLAQTTEQLRTHILDLLSYNPQCSSPNLDRFLENAREDYDMDRVLRREFFSKDR